MQTTISTLLKSLHNSVNTLNKSKLFAGIVMIMLNVGSKYITIKLSHTQEMYLHNTLARQILIFSIAFIGSKDIYYAITITAAFVFLSDYLLNEESRLCVLPKRLQVLKKSIDINKDGIISENELDHAISVLSKAKHKIKVNSTNF